MSGSSHSNGGSSQPEYFMPLFLCFHLLTSCEPDNDKRGAEEETLGRLVQDLEDTSPHGYRVKGFAGWLTEEKVL